jgi:AcrR family transcriptional regulator
MRRGRHAATVADIAAAAEVAPRTVPLYFRSEQDIARSWFTESLNQLRDREPHDTAMEIPGRWLRTEGQDDETNRLGHRMFAANRELRASGDTAYRVSLGGHRLTITHTDGFPRTGKPRHADQPVTDRGEFLVMRGSYGRQGGVSGAARRVSAEVLG